MAALRLVYNYNLVFLEIVDARMAAEEKYNLAMVEVERLKTLIQGHQNEGKEVHHFVLQFFLFIAL